MIAKTVGAIRERRMFKIAASGSVSLAHRLAGDVLRLTGGISEGKRKDSCTSASVITAAAGQLEGGRER